jgi:hypothetical protein
MIPAREDRGSVKETRNALGHVYFIFICRPPDGQLKDEWRGPAFGKKVVEKTEMAESVLNYQQSVERE